MVSTLTHARGVDISVVQARCDFKAFKAGGGDFVIPKATEGKWTDPTFKAHTEDALAAGVLVPAAYHVLSATSDVGAQIETALNAVAPYLGMAVIVDFEVEDHLPAGQSVMRCLQFADGVKIAGRKVLVYSYPDYMKQRRGAMSLALLAQTAEYFGASYGDQKAEPDDSVQPYVPEAWGGRWTFHQWSGDGGLPAPGIPQVVDHDHFNGTKEDLIAWMTPSDNPY